MAYYTVAQKRAFQEKLDRVFNECIEELNAIEVPFRRITDVTVNYRAKSRWGQCKTEYDEYGLCFSINISAILLTDEAPEKGLKETVIHEILHTVKNGMCHTGEWLKWVEVVNDCYGYHIKRTNTAEDKGIDAEVFKAARTQKIKYRFRCADCGAEINRTRESNFTKHYTMYRCGKCHGKIVKVA